MMKFNIRRLPQIQPLDTILASYRRVMQLSGAPYNKRLFCNELIAEYGLLPSFILDYGVGNPNIGFTFPEEPKILQPITPSISIPQGLSSKAAANATKDTQYSLFENALCEREQQKISSLREVSWNLYNQNNLPLNAPLTNDIISDFRQWVVWYNNQPILPFSYCIDDNYEQRNATDYKHNFLTVFNNRKQRSVETLFPIAPLLWWTVIRLW